jgi:hypothetical protein
MATAWLLIGLFPGLSAYHLSNGLETSLAMAATVWAVVLMLESEHRKRTLLPVLLGVMPFIRPELGALTLLLGLARMGEIKRHATSQKALLAQWTQLWMVVGLAAAPFLLIYALTLGQPIPNTVSAKKYFFAEGCRPIGDKAATGIVQLARFLVHLGVAGFGLLGLFGRRGRFLLLFFVLFLAAYVTSLPGALAHNDQRYLYPFVPVLVYGLILLTDKTRGLEVAAVLLMVVQLAVLGVPGGFAAGLEARRFTRDERGGAALWIRSNLPADAKILIHDAGFISLATANPMIDLVGLKTPSITGIHRDVTWASCGADRSEAYRMILERYRPAYLVVLSEWDEIFGITRDMSESAALTLERPSERGYRVYRIE